MQGVQGRVTLSEDSLGKDLFENPFGEPTWGYTPYTPPPPRYLFAARWDPFDDRVRVLLGLYIIDYRGVKLGVGERGN